MKTGAAVRMPSARQAMVDWLSVIHLLGSRPLVAELLWGEQSGQVADAEGAEYKEPVGR